MYQKLVKKVFKPQIDCNMNAYFEVTLDKSPQLEDHIINP